VAFPCSRCTAVHAPSTVPRVTAATVRRALTLPSPAPAPLLRTQRVDIPEALLLSGGTSSSAGELVALLLQATGTLTAAAGAVPRAYWLQAQEELPQGAGPGASLYLKMRRYSCSLGDYLKSHVHVEAAAATRSVDLGSLLDLMAKVRALLQGCDPGPPCPVPTLVACMIMHHRSHAAALSCTAARMHLLHAQR
jgi:hypothetical protein